MKNTIIYLLFTAVVTFSFSGCIKDNTDNFNTKIRGWEIDSIDFSYNWISPADAVFLNSKIGYIVGSNGDLIKTTDSGQSWTKSIIDSTGVMTSSMSFINDTTGFIYGTWNILNGDYYGILYKTTNGGKNWVKQLYSTAYHLLFMKFFDTFHGIALNWTSPGPTIVTTADGGLSWNVGSVELDPSTFRLFYLGEICYVTGKDNKILKSSDHGSSWSTINTPKSSSGFIYGYYYLDKDFAFLNMGDKKYKTTDGGIFWNELTKPFPGFNTPGSNFGDFHFCNKNEGIFIKDSIAYTGGDFPSFIGTYVYTTTDGGNQWIRSTFLKNFSFGNVVFISDNTAYCISNKYIYKLQKR
jgi:photosystem II stability/assembly factor-like uncharacterized protein